MGGDKNSLTGSPEPLGRQAGLRVISPVWGRKFRKGFPVEVMSKVKLKVGNEGLRGQEAGIAEMGNGTCTLYMTSPGVIPGSTFGPPKYNQE